MPSTPAQQQPPLPGLALPRCPTEVHRPLAWVLQLMRDMASFPILMTQGQLSCLLIDIEGLRM